MRVLTYKGLDPGRHKVALNRLCQTIAAEDWRSAHIKKLHPSPYWRAKLSDADRVLLQFLRAGSETVCLMLEIIANHAYDKSRFLRGAVVDEAKIDSQAVADRPAIERDSAQAPALRWVGPNSQRFELLDKPIVFDPEQDAAHQQTLPALIIGSAGSGKTAVTLSRLREQAGAVAYITQSAYLAQSARALFEAHGFVNPQQQPLFLSLRDYIDTLRIPSGREVTFVAFAAWLARRRHELRGLPPELDAHALFEEFRGVLGAAASGPLDLDAYQSLGIRQSLVPPELRATTHALFIKYRQWLGEEGLFDLNLVAHALRPLVQPQFDCVVVDEVQDLTPVQLDLILASLKQPGQFLLCGDAHQIVHPNFFSWAAVRALFREVGADQTGQQVIRILQSNFRNAQAITRLANDLLRIKHARFGSVDRESNHLVRSTAASVGEVRLLPAKEAVLRDLDAVSRASVHHAVIVLRDEDKAAAREHLRTPLVFSVHEAKGLEYSHVILFQLVSGQRGAYAELCEGVTADALQVEELAWSRARDKTDKSLELFKFYINALYVAVTRAVESVTLVESDVRHPLFGLLGLQEKASVGGLARTESTRQEWEMEARKLALQGKEEQARAIRDTFLASKPVPWTPWTRAFIEDLLPKALDRRQPSNKPRQALLDYALWHGQHRWIERLATEAGFAQARSIAPDGVYPVRESRIRVPEWDRQADFAQRAWLATRQRLLQPYSGSAIKDMLRQCDVHGIDHRTPTGATVLMMAAKAGNLALVDALLARGADPAVRDEFGHDAWLFALSRAIDDPAFAQRALGPLIDRIAPSALDVQTDGRLVRLEHGQAEYWILSLMLAGLKTLSSRATPKSLPPYKYARGFFADMLLDVLLNLPESVWPAHRRKRSHVNQVLARAEVQSNYRPARRLWTRTTNGHYVPNADMLLRAGSDAQTWVPAVQVLQVDWVVRGTAEDSA
ncbi:ankyrin repeat domain-containing protein [Thiomonas sp.]|uniref:AAA family ATPase n=1 Tax=Thiomonas sp. TaxID=2047785 RepID=UPI002629B8B9|nr:ankyrin repeat domain-containing protein [Thiomonas sp.]